MSTLTDRDILKALGRDLVIEPLNDMSVTPTGYDLTIGKGVLIDDYGERIIPQKEGYLIVPPSRSAVVLTGEQLWISRRLVGTLHSRGTLAARGLLVNSTTVDPNWQGVLVLRLFNTTSSPIELKSGETFVTLMLHRASTPTSAKSATEPKGMLQGFVPDPVARGVLTDYLTALSHREFDEKVARARSTTLVIDSLSRWASGVPSWLTRALSWLYGVLLISAATFGVLSLVKWEFVRAQIKKLGTDPGPLNAQTVVAACSLLLVALSALRAHGRRS